MSVFTTEPAMTIPIRPPRHEYPEQTAELRLVALPNAVATARRFVRHQLCAWRLDDLVENVELVVSELAGNSAKFTGLPKVPNSYVQLYDVCLAMMIVRLRLGPTDLYAEIWDSSDEPPVVAAPADNAESGRGLMIVANLSDEWAYYPSIRGGKVTWSRWRIKPQYTHRSVAHALQRDAVGHSASPIRTRRAPGTRWQISATDGSGDLDTGRTGGRRRTLRHSR